MPWCKLPNLLVDVLRTHVHNRLLFWLGKSTGLQSRPAKSKWWQTQNPRYMALSQAKDPQADVYLAKCLRKGKAGLADFMSLPDGTRFAQDDVVDGAAAYICSLQDAPLCADFSYRLHVEDSFMQTRAERRSAVDKNPDEIGLAKDTFRLVLKRIKPTAECRGIPYAALLAEAEEHFQFVLLMHKLALTFGVTASVWTMQDLYHSLKPNRAPQCYMSYRALGLNSAHSACRKKFGLPWCLMCGKLLVHSKKAVRNV